MPILPQKPRDLTEILTASFELFTECFTKIIGYSLIMFVLNSLLSFVIDTMPLPDTTLSSETQMQEQMAALLQVLPGILAMSGVVMLASCVCYSAMLYRIDNVARGRVDDFFGTLLQPINKIPSIFLAGILYAIAVTVGCFLLLIPGIILMMSLGFFWYFILLEDFGVIQSLTASHRLVWGDWWRTFIVFFVPVFIFFIIVSPMFFLVDLIAGSSSMIISVSSDLLSAIATQYFSVLGYLQYHDLKLRKNM